MRLRNLFVLCMLASCAAAQSAVPAASPASSDDAKLPKLEHFTPDIADKSLDPCQDFYKYSCGKWVAANPIPADEVAWGTGDGLQYWNENVLKETLEAAAAKQSGRTPNEQKIGDFWAACMDEKGIEAAGTRDLKPELQRIDHLTSKSQLAEEIAHLHMILPGAAEVGDDNYAQSPLFAFGELQDYDDASKVVAGIDQGGMSLPSRDFYLGDDAKSEEIRDKFVAHIARMFQLAGEDKAEAEADAKTVLSVQTAMAKIAMDNVSRRDPKKLNNKMSLDQVEGLMPSFQLSRYLEITSPPPSAPHYLVLTPDYFKGLDQLIQQRSLGEWQAYLRYDVIHQSAPYLSKAFVDENWDFYAHELFGAKEQRPRFRRCVRAADANLGEALGQAYVARAFPPASKQGTLELVHGVEHALSEDITTTDWMQDATKKEAQTKLKAIEDKIGYPDKWRDYSSVTITSTSYLNNVRAANEFEFKRQLSKIGKPVDRGEWTMTPPTINAYYDPQLNTINFPAGILQPPYFELDKDISVNYGAIGAVVGHEITHGFDDQGRQFDAQGNLRDWWTPADAKAYDERGKCIADQYSQAIPEVGVIQNGKLTQGEDTADNGGTRLAFMAMEAQLKSEGRSLDTVEADGWTPRQRYFLAFGYSWCTEYRPELMHSLLNVDPHSIPKYRVNNTLSNMPEFQKAFSCKPGSKMVNPNACRVW